MPTRILPLLLLATACSAQAPTIPPPSLPLVFPAAEWATASPAAAGLDQARLDAMVQQVESGAVRDIASIMVVRHGYVVLERYFSGSHRDDVHTMQSVSKSVTSLIVGAAIANGSLTAQQKVLDVLAPAYAQLGAGEPRKKAITIEHLLTMRSGINFHESPYPGSPLERLNNSNGDWAAIALGEPMNADPGARWQYNSGGVIALAAVVRAATGESFQAFSARNLFSPIGITTQRWSASPFDGLAHGGGGLQLRTVDLARIGLLMLRRGEWEGVRVIPADWIDRSVARTTRSAVTYGGQPLDYGYLWYSWPLGGAQHPDRWNNIVIAAAGNMTQWLFVVPRHDLVMVVTGVGNRSFDAPIRMLRDYVLGR